MLTVFDKSIYAIILISMLSFLTASSCANICLFHDSMSTMLKSIVKELFVPVHRPHSNCYKWQIYAIKITAAAQLTCVRMRRLINHKKICKFGNGNYKKCSTMFWMLQLCEPMKWKCVGRMQKHSSTRKYLFSLLWQN
jgi:hypothetical protein